LLYSLFLAIQYLTPPSLRTVLMVFMQKRQSQ
jgi:hypothetical protein